MERTSVGVAKVADNSQNNRDDASENHNLKRHHAVEHREKDLFDFAIREQKDDDSAQDDSQQTEPKPKEAPKTEDKSSAQKKEGGQTEGEEEPIMMEAIPIAIADRSNRLKAIPRSLDRQLQ